MGVSTGIIPAVSLSLLSMDLKKLSPSK